ncbi:MAG: rhodanese-like domain-containing protein [Rhodospirillales bacterium]|jgi:rhodanese-related sulfurtransferase
MELDKIFTSENLLLAAVFLVALQLPRLLRKLNPPAKEVTAAALQARLADGDDILVLDVRSPEEFRGELGHIQGALNLPLPELSQRLAQLGGDLEAHKAAPVVVTCRTDNRSASAAGILKKAGFTNLSILTGGMTGWNKSKLPTSRN